MSNIRQVDMCRGALFSKIVVFSLPLLATYVLTHLFNAADLLVIGRFAPHQAMAAIGSTLSLVGLLINVTCAMSTGVQVLCAQAYGAKDYAAMQKTIHTAFTATAIGGIIFSLTGMFLTEKALIWLCTPGDIIDQAKLYVRIYLIGLPAVAIMACGSAILRAVGDTVKPMIFLIISGIANVLLNLFFVIVCKMDVAGVAWATTAANVLSMLLVIRTLMRTPGICRFSFKKIGIEFNTLWKLLKIAIPSAVQGSCFSLSNMTIQSAVNSFGSLAVAGAATSQIFEGIIYVGCFALNLTATTFVAQNYGGNKYKRILKSVFCCMATAFAINVSFAATCIIFSRELSGFFNPNPDVIKWAVLRIHWLLPLYFICSFMDVFCGSLRGLGYSLLPAMSSILGACVFRIWWAKVVFPHYKTMENLLISYPISWTLIAGLSGSIFFFVYRRLIHQKTLRFSGRSHILSLRAKKAAAE